VRLAEFILANMEPILAEWEAFAGSVSPGANMDRAALRDHAGDILRASARDMLSKQSGTEQSDKSKGLGEPGQRSENLNEASAVHGIGRVGSGFDLMEMVSEYRALRASVIRLWRDSRPSPDLRDLDDLTRFNESVDQSLTRAVRSYTKRVDESRQMFLAILGHDLRNPLNSIMMSAQLVALDAKNSETAESASQILASANAISQLTSDLLDFASSGLGAAMPLSPAAMDLKKLCQEVVNEVQAAHPSRTIRVEAAGDFAGEWDAARIRQLISNLIGNAIQHGAPGRDIGVSLDGNGDTVMFDVCNDGTPITSEVLATMFEPLVRGTAADSERRRKPGSIGLGLYIAREIATAHGGTIDATSTVESGTTFRVRIPRRRAKR
jgi:signal transduction histidine kinase